MCVKRICLYCNKKYIANIKLGAWQKDGTQSFNKSGVSSKKYCCYQCGKKARAESIKNTWKSKNKSELKNIFKKHQNCIKEQTCTVCGKKFYPTNVGGKKGIHICSEECRKKRSRKIANSGIITCLNCNKQYTYIENQGSWNKNNKLVNAKGLGHEFVIRSDHFCCYECGIQYKEKQRKITNLNKYGRISPFQDSEFRKQLFQKQKEEGTQFISKGEKELKDWIESLGIKVEHYITGNGLDKKSPRIEIDLYLPDLKIGIEYNGVYFHSINGKKEGKIFKEYHYNKSKIAKQLDIDLIHVWEDQWINQKSLIKDILLSRFNIVNNINEYKITENITNKKVILNLITSKYTQVITFKKYNFINAYYINTDNYINYNKYCEKILFEYFIKKYNPKYIIYDINTDLFSADQYKDLNFKVIKNLGQTKFYITADHYYKRSKILPNNKKYWLCYNSGTVRLMFRQ